MGSLSGSPLRSSVLCLKDTFLHKGLFLLCACLHLGTALAEDELAVYFEDRAPFSSMDAEGQVAGLVATPAENAFRLAGVPHDWVMVPYKRQLMQLQQNAEPACGIGFFKTPERERLAKFTSAVYRDGQTVILANQGFHPKEKSKLAEVMVTRDVRVLRKDASTYGPFIDDAMDKARPKVVSTTAELKNMALMIAAGRADFMLITREEAQQLIDASGDAGKRLHIIQVADMPLGQTRHIMCSSQVPDAVIERLNKAIERR
ncbi:substrate-binding periplasmic protein [Undibacterium sp.]|jgi:polar amino acid transport system substrate-binding protein|uniref:substrate-binding periplasmic protein n=1 Tax=Undibacterium sp. TaxID=1914977 RepID=UPI002B7FB652|nr:transporter substrate-binding domain-containing protein [Undibacterium sp.]HTD03150.1 transporter substrate-binding domain-containing protein [Undibacterium sp.]